MPPTIRVFPDAEAVSRAHPPQAVVDSLLIGVDLGPNLSATGSLRVVGFEVANIALTTLSGSALYSFVRLP